MVKKHKTMLIQFIAFIISIILLNLANKYLPDSVWSNTAEIILAGTALVFSAKLLKGMQGTNKNDEDE